MRRTRVTQRSTSSVTLAGTVFPAAVVVVGLAGIVLAIPSTSNLPVPTWACWVFVIYALNSLIAMLLYGFDKKAATQRQYRVPEKTLHLVELLGGWPGALFAIPLFRHKYRKGGFLIITGLIILAHVAFWTWLSQR